MIDIYLACSFTLLFLTPILDTNFLFLSGIFQI